MVEGGLGSGEKVTAWPGEVGQARRVTDLVNACNRSLEGNCQSGLPEVFLLFYFWQTLWFKWFCVTVSGTIP